MSVQVTFRGTVYTIPSPGESNDWADLLNAFLMALAAAQPTTALTGTGVTTTPGVTAAGSATGKGLVASSGAVAAAAAQIVPQASQPSRGDVGDLYVTTAGVLKICTVAGTPGTWVSVGAQT